MWKRTTGYDICVQSSLAVHNDIVYTGSSHTFSYFSGGYTESATGAGCENIYALNATTGDIIWNYTTGGGIWSSPAVASGFVFVGSGDNRVYALNAQTGDLEWSYETNGAIYSSPAILDGVAYVGSTDNSLYAIGSTKSADDLGVQINPYHLIIVGITAFTITAIIFLLFRKRQTKSSSF